MGLFGNQQWLSGQETVWHKEILPQCEWPGMGNPSTKSLPWILESFHVSLIMNYCRERQEQNSSERIDSSAAATPQVLAALAPFRLFPWALRPLRSSWIVFHCAGLPRRLGVALSPSCRLEIAFEHQDSPHCQTGKGWRRPSEEHTAVFFPSQPPYLSDNSREMECIVLGLLQVFGQWTKQSKTMWGDRTKMRRGLKGRWWRISGPGAPGAAQATDWSAYKH